jgi:O-antigen/teichoic acid export membrane protein
MVGALCNQGDCGGMTIILTFVINSALNFALGLIVAKYLGPEEFGRYAIANAVATVVNTLLLDWLRLSTTRFYSERSRQEEPAVRATVETTFVTIALALLAVAAIVILMGIDFGLSPALLAGTAAMTIAIGLFDVHTAMARARFLEGAYAQLVIVKNVAMFALMVGAAALFHDAAVVAAGFAAGSATAVLIARLSLRDPGLGPKAARLSLTRTFLTYGLPLVGANAIFQLMTIANRSLVANAYGFAEAGYFSLAADLGIRIFAVAGSAVDIFLFQLAVRIDEVHGRTAASRQVARNLVLILAFLAPLAVGYAMLLPFFQRLFVPASFEGAFAAYSLVLVPALLSFALVQFALNPVFQIEKRTAPVIVAAGFGLAVDLALILVLPPRYGPIGFAFAQMGGMLAALALTAVLALRLMPEMPRSRDILAIAAATAMLAAILALFRQLDNIVIVILGGLAAAAVYGGIILACDVGALRAVLAKRLLSGARHAETDAEVDEKN